MNIKYLFFLPIFILSNRSQAQFAPPAGQIGSTAIHVDSTCFINWANNCEVSRGFVNISDTTFEYNSNVYASYGMADDGKGKADGVVVSLGDRGIATLEFNPAIANGIGWDFAVFENSLNDSFLELAFVEVSSDGINFFRFPCYSNTQTEIQTATFGNTDPTKIHNLAGKYRAPYGTPFNLDEISDDNLLDKSNIRFVRLIDVVGSLDPDFASYDTNQNIINDPWPTAFNTCGFDLDGIGVINNRNNTAISSKGNFKISVFPNPSKEEINIMSIEKIQEINIFSIQGQLLYSDNTEKKSTNIYIGHFEKGIYIIQIITRNYQNSLKFLKQ